MSTEIRIRTGELYSKDEACGAIGCGKWYVEALVKWYGLLRLGGGNHTMYEGGAIIAAMQRHAVDDVVEPRCETPPTKDELTKRGREQRKK